MEAPIFIGGTGRSGTTILAHTLDLHPEVQATASEIKLIVEPYGLVGLVDPLTDRWGLHDAHFALTRFMLFADQLRYTGYRHPVLRWLAALLGKKRESLLFKLFPRARYGLYPVARRFGLSHYDACLRKLLCRLISAVDTGENLDTLGRMCPVYIGRRFERPALVTIFRSFLAELYSGLAGPGGKRRWCDDTPRNLAYADFLWELFPDMKFIHMLRDPRDVVASFGDQLWASKHVDLNIQCVKNVLDCWVTLRPRLPRPSYLEVRLEDLSEQPEATLRRICDFAELPFDTRLLTGALSRSQSHTGRYRSQLTPEQVRAIETQLAPWMSEHGYCDHSSFSTRLSA
jgi:hypothetical protein